MRISVVIVFCLFGKSILHIDDNSIINEVNHQEQFPQSQLHDGMPPNQPKPLDDGHIPNFVSHPDNVVPENVMEITDAVADEIIKSYDVMLLNFHADWCHFSKMLDPVFEQAWDEVRKAIPNNAKVLFAKMDCDKNIATCTKYHVNKYPTIKIFRLGSDRKEYRGERSATALSKFILDQLKDHLINLTSPDEVHRLSKNESTVIAYFKDKDTLYYKTLQVAGFYLRDSCKFYVGIGESFQPEYGDKSHKLLFRPAHLDQSEIYNGSMEALEDLSRWIFLKCTPLLREITRENAEELTEEELPFIILFYDPKNLEPIKVFHDAVHRDLAQIRNTINPVYANGDVFSHPLHHLGKSSHDLPLIAIDSFRHMYVFPDFKNIHTPGSLLNFVNDLHSGKLHRDFHNIPEPVVEHAQQHVNHQQKPAKTTVPESTFKKLKPSYTRYTLLKPRDEL